MGMNEFRFRQAEQRLWESVGVAPTERLVHLDRAGCAVRVQEVGAGPTVVFVHGVSNGGSSWASLVAGSTGSGASWSTVPDAGLSQPFPSRPDGLEGVEAHADHLIVDVLDALGLARSHVVATSFGGYFALRGRRRTLIGSTESSSSAGPSGRRWPRCRW